MAVRRFSLCQGSLKCQARLDGCRRLHDDGIPGSNIPARLTARKELISQEEVVSLQKFIADDETLVGSMLGPLSHVRLKPQLRRQIYEQILVKMTANFQRKSILELNPSTALMMKYSPRLHAYVLRMLQALKHLDAEEITHREKAAAVGVIAICGEYVYDQLEFAEALFGCKHILLAHVSHSGDILSLVNVVHFMHRYPRHVAAHFSDLVHAVLDSLAENLPHYHKLLRGENVSTSFRLAHVCALVCNMGILHAPFCDSLSQYMLADMPTLMPQLPLYMLSTCRRKEQELFSAIAELPEEKAHHLTSDPGGRMLVKFLWAFVAQNVQPPAYSVQALWAQLEQMKSNPRSVHSPILWKILGASCLENALVLLEQPYVTQTLSSSDGRRFLEHEPLALINPVTALGPVAVAGIIHASSLSFLKWPRFLEPHNMSPAIASSLAGPAVVCLLVDKEGWLRDAEDGSMSWNGVVDYLYLGLVKQGWHVAVYSSREHGVDPGRIVEGISKEMRRAVNWELVSVREENCRLSLDPEI